MNDSVLIEPAATLVLVRDSADGPQVLMQQRNPKAVFVGGAWVFPGGKLDTNDSAAVWQSLASDFSENEAFQILDLNHSNSPYNADQIHAHEAKAPTQTKALAYWIAALREAFEEAGLLLVKETVSQAQRDQWRAQLLREKITWQQLIEDNQLTPATHQLHYLSRWVTPPGNPRRYDTRFFITKAPVDQLPSHEDFEAIQTRWITPQAALQESQQGKMQLILPTIVTLRAMSDPPENVATADQLIDHVTDYFNHQG